MKFGVRSTKLQLNSGIGLLNLGFRFRVDVLEGEAAAWLAGGDLRWGRQGHPAPPLCPMVSDSAFTTPHSRLCIHDSTFTTPHSRPHEAEIYELCVSLHPKPLQCIYYVRRFAFCISLV